tara:strand:+ start:636 stop:2906 length:2271 start_codon:yes stop_codon:yes gene_type:complete
MPKALLIVESPSKAKTIQQYLNNEYQVLASYGHVRDLIPKNGAVEPDKDFTMHYSVIERNQKHVDKIIQQAKKSSHIYLATDPDREGEAIAWHIQHLIQSIPKCRDIPCERLVFYQITRKAVNEALKKPRKIEMSLVNAQQARRALDYLVGFNLSPLLWKKIRRGLSAGRVQSPALKMIVERENEIRDFVSQEYWKISTEHEKDQISFVAKLIHFNNEKVENLSIKDESQANDMVAAIEAASQGSLTVSDIVEKERKRNPPPPYTTSTLQQDAVRKLGFSASRTMRIAQQLYEGVKTSQGQTGLITYMRTDSVQMGPEAINAARTYIKEKLGDDFLPSKPRTFKTKTKNAQEAHEAIRPNDFNRTPESVMKFLDKDQLKLYRLIWQRALASQTEAATLDTVAVDLIAKEVALFRANGSTIKHPGYLKVYEEGQDDNKVSALDEKNLLPKLTKNESLSINKLNADQHFTEPPARFNEATLVKHLEELGIGRPSTYTSIISTLLDREYVEKNEQKRFVPTDVGEIVCGFLNKHFDKYVEYGFTANLEDQLDAVSRGEVEWVPLMDDFWSPFHKQIDVIGENVQRSDVTQEAIEEKCPKCGSDLYIKLGKRGKFIGCSSYPDCDYTSNIDGTTEPETPELVDKPCPKCEADLVYKYGKYGKFIGCSRYPDCKYIESLNQPTDTGIQCPECNKNNIMKRFSRRGKVFYGCQGYPSCKYALWNEPVSQACPACKWPIMTKKVTKKAGEQIICPACKHELES